MIIDSFDNQINEFLTKDILFGVKTLADTKPDIDFGTYNLKDNIRLIIDSYPLQSQVQNEELYEVHSHTIDIQYPLIGYEVTHFVPYKVLKKVSEYDAEVDRSMFKRTSEFASTIVTGNGVYAIFYPGDPHSPQKGFDNKLITIKKATIKIII